MRSYPLYILVIFVLLAAGIFYWMSGTGQEPASELYSDDRLRLTAPSINEIVGSPLIVEGEARGFWFFEASFPIRIFDANGQELGVAVAQAQDEWMTENFVPFKAELNFDEPATANGFLVLEKDNPSGLPEHADEIRIPVFFE